MPRPVLLCTVGTSLFHPNLAGLTAGPLADAYRAADWSAVSRLLAVVPADDRVCGAELNATDSLVREGVVSADARVVLFHSDTADGRTIGAVLAEVLRLRGFVGSEAVAVDDLQDADPERFRLRGLRQLARRMGATIRAAGRGGCAINATGGFKAQVGVAMLVGQAAGVPVYYRHERFPTVIAFPPLPLTFDAELWRRHRALFTQLDAGPVSRSEVPTWDARLTGLVEQSGGVVQLTAGGQVFHDACRE